MSSEIQLLTENWFLALDVIQSNEAGTPILEAKLEKNELGSCYYIEGIFLQANIVNKNNRLYPKDVLIEAIDEYNKTQIITKQSLGEFNHPADRAYPDPLQSCIIVEKFWWVGDNVHGRARVINNDNAQGTKLVALLSAGWIPGVSSRGLGSLVKKGTYNEVQPGFKLTVGVDIVWGPSGPNAYVKPVVENNINIQESVKSDLNKQKSTNNVKKIDDSAINLINNIKRIYK